MVLLIPIIILGAFEIAAFIQVGDWVGVLPTIFLCFLTAATGIYLVKRQGLKTLARMQEAQQRGEAPVAEVMTGICLLLAGICLILPGFVTDIIGFFLLIPSFRNLAGDMVNKGVNSEAFKSANKKWTKSRFGDYGPTSSTVVDVDYEEVPPKNSDQLPRK